MPGWVLLLAAGVVAVIGAVLVAVLPARLTRRSGLDSGDRFDAENEWRKIIIQGFSTIFVLLGVLGAVYQFTETQRTTERTLRLTQLGQQNQALQRATDQLGARDVDGRKSMEVRLGAIYALDAMLANAPLPDRRPILNVLAAYVRMNSTSERPPASPPPFDVVEALKTADRYWTSMIEIDLGRSDLSHADLPELSFVGPALDGARLTRTEFHGQLPGAQFRGAAARRMRARYVCLTEGYFDRAPSGGARTDLIQADFHGAILRFARFEEARLTGARLTDADLRMATLAGADLRGAVLTGADLRFAVLDGADLRGAKLAAANLAGASLRGADLRGVEHLEVQPDQVTEARLDAALRARLGVTPKSVSRRDAVDDAPVPPSLEDVISLPDGVPVDVLTRRIADVSCAYGPEARLPRWTPADR